MKLHEITNPRNHHANLHAKWRTEQEPDFELSYLPPYSPNLNPIERVWKLTRRLCLHNRYFPTLADVLETVEGQVKVQFTTGILGVVDAVNGPVDDVLAMWSIRAARDAAWTHAELLWQ